MTNPSPLYRLIERQLDGTLADFVARHRTDGATWPEIAADVSAKTDVEISGETLRRWFAGRITVEVRVA